MSVDIEQVKTVIKLLETLKRTEDIGEDERDMLNRSLIPLKLFLLMRRQEEAV